MGQEPDPEQMPIEPIIDFDLPAQQAFFLYHTLPDKIDSMGGIWLGKELAGILDIMIIYDIYRKREVMDYLLFMIQTARSAYSSKREQESKMRK